MTKCDLTFFVEEVSDGLALEIEYDADVIDGRLLRAHAARLPDIFEALASEPGLGEGSRARPDCRVIPV